MQESWRLLGGWAKMNRLKVCVYDDHHGQWWTRGCESLLKSVPVPRGLDQGERIVRVIFFFKEGADEGEDVRGSYTSDTSVWGLGTRCRHQSATALMCGLVAGTRLLFFDQRPASRSATRTPKAPECHTKGPSSDSVGMNTNVAAAALMIGSPAEASATAVHTQQPQQRGARSDLGYYAVEDPGRGVVPN